MNPLKEKRFWYEDLPPWPRAKAQLGQASHSLKSVTRQILQGVWRLGFPLTFLLLGIRSLFYVVLGDAGVSGQKESQR